MRIFLVRIIVLVLAVNAAAQTTNLRQRIIGHSACANEFNSSLSHYGVRLDGRMRAYLEARVFKGQTILAIVQHADDVDHCGIVRDLVTAQAPNDAFIFECTDKADPSAPVVGTWPANRTGRTGPSVEAWKIDLENLKFGQLKSVVTCTSEGYAGWDEGDDLASRARKRSTEK